ncbi:MAG: hypothetical protein AAGL49_14795, partial [Pseudomonadota bacterium]
GAAYLDRLDRRASALAAAETAIVHEIKLLRQAPEAVAIETRLGQLYAANTTATSVVDQVGLLGAHAPSLRAERIDIRSGRMTVTGYTPQEIGNLSPALTPVFDSVQASAGGGRPRPGWTRHTVHLTPMGPAE